MIDLGPAPFWQTQAVYHAVAGLMNESAPDTIILTSPRTPYLCLGYHDVYDAVLDRAAVARRGLPVLRRRVGGGTTYLDSNQIFYQCVFHHARVPPVFGVVYAGMLAAPLAALRRLGLDATLRDTVELEVGGRRVAGIGGGRIGAAAVVVGNLLLDFDYEAMVAVWRAPWPAYRALAAAALRDRVTTLRRLGVTTTLDAVAALLREEFACTLGRPLLPGALTPAETRSARRLGARMADPDYLDLHGDRPVDRLRPLKIAAGVFLHAAIANIAGYLVQASLLARDERIAAARLDSNPPLDWSLAEGMLAGACVTEWYEVVAQCLAQREGFAPLGCALNA
ncbi:MAG: lipoate--protein ligase family protein [Kouleothrix sp.]|nr:lipoate--protein ligase family protein [Kouleothrix sp.]